jgi:hypothetical protein
MDKHTMELPHSQCMAFTALVAQHLQRQERLDEYVDCNQEPEVVTRGLKNFSRCSMSK